LRKCKKSRRRKPLKTPRLWLNRGRPKEGLIRALAKIACRHAAIEDLSLAGRKVAGQNRAFLGGPTEGDLLPSVSCFTKARR
jgi:hypothetical protein